MAQQQPGTRRGRDIDLPRDPPLKVTTPIAMDDFFQREGLTSADDFFKQEGLTSADEFFRTQGAAPKPPRGAGPGTDDSLRLTPPPPANPIWGPLGEVYKHGRNIVGNVADAAGLSPSGMYEGVKGLLQLAKDPSQIPRVAAQATVGPALKLFNPEVRKGAINLVRKGGLNPFTGPVLAPEDMRGLEALPVLGPEFAHANQQIAGGDVEGGLSRYAGIPLGLAAPLKIPGPVRRAVGAAVRTPTRAVARTIGTTAMHPGPGVPAGEIARATETAFEENLLGGGINRAQAKTRQLVEDLGDETARGAVTPPGEYFSRPEPPVQYFGESPTFTPPTKPSRLEQFYNDPRLAPLQRPAAREAAAEIFTDPAMPRDLTGPDAVRFAQGMRERSIRDPFDSARTGATEAAAGQISDWVGEASPTSRAALERLERLHETEQALARSKGPSFGGPMSTSNRAAGYAARFATPAAQRLYNLGRPKPAAGRTLEELVRAAILAQIGGE